MDLYSSSVKNSSVIGTDFSVQNLRPSRSIKKKIGSFCFRDSFAAPLIASAISKTSSFSPSGRKFLRTGKLR